MPVFYKYLFLFLAVVTPLFYVYNRGYQTASERATAKQMEAEKRAQEELNRIQERHAFNIAKYIEQVEELTFQHEQDLAELERAQIVDTIQIPNDIINGVIHSVDKCDRMPERKAGPAGVQTAEVKSGLLCYTETELRGKIKKSLDIAGECDKLAVKYKSLLETCSHE